MRGVHATERLKFDHPGLGTIATRAGGRSSSRTTSATTDAHVVVIRVTELVVTITYTDVHLARLLFFQELLGAVAGGAGRTRGRAATRRSRAGCSTSRAAVSRPPTTAELERFLEHLGSRLVFIIDWNRARKRLRRLVGRRAAIELLRWAAEQGYGHMAFLRAGADGLVYDALEFAGGRAARPGESLQDVLGRGGGAGVPAGGAADLRRGLLAGKTVLARPGRGPRPS